MITNQYAYNGDGQRIQVIDSQGTKKAIWDNENILLETDSSDNTQVVYTLEPARYGNLISQRRGSTSSYFLFDALGSTRKLTNAAKAVTDSYDFRAYGDTYASSGATINAFRWIGQLGYYFDIDRGAYHLRARSYSPQLARFLSEDPLNASDLRGMGVLYLLLLSDKDRYTDVVNMYLYAKACPSLFSDPSGLITLTCLQKQLLCQAGYALLALLCVDLCMALACPWGPWLCIPCIASCLVASIAGILECAQKFSPPNCIDPPPPPPPPPTPPNYCPPIA